MTDVQEWVDGVAARLEAVKREPAQEERDYDHESRAWSDLYQHAPSDLSIATTVLQSILNRHYPLDVNVKLHGMPDRKYCQWCSCEDYLAPWPCMELRVFEDAIEGREA